MKTTRILLAVAVCAAMLFAGCSEKGGEDQPKTYTVTVTSGGNGTAVADKTTATRFETVKLTATPDPGYGFDKWTVVKGDVMLSSKAPNPVTFAMRAGDVEISAKFIVRGVFINGTMWAFCNVDAPGTFAANPEDTGVYYQWNRRAGWSSSNLVNIFGEMKPWDNTIPAGDKWEATNDPCPVGWRVPTREEYVALCDDEKTTIGEWTALNGVKGRWFTDDESGNSIFLPAAGYRTTGNGALNYPGIYGYYWSASPLSGSAGYALYLATNGVYPAFNYLRTEGFAVRCVLK